MLSLLPQEDPAVRTYVETLQDFGSSTYLLVAIRIPEGAVVDPYETLADRLAERLARLPDLKTVQHKVGEPQELLETFYPKALLFLDEAGRKKLEERLSDEGIRAPGERGPAPDHDAAGPGRQGAAPDRSRSAWPTSSSAVSSPPAARLRVDWTSGYYLSGDHSLLLILAEPVRPPQDIEFAEQLAAKVDRIVDGGDGQSGRRSPGRRWKAPEVVVGGPHLTALGDAALIRKDMLLEPRHRGAQRAAVLLVHLPAAGDPDVRDVAADHRPAPHLRLRRAGGRLAQLGDERRGGAAGRPRASTS